MMDEQHLSILHGDLPADAIDIWHLDLNEERADWDVLDEEERNRAQRIRVPDKRVQFVSARAQVRYILASYLGCRPDAVRFGYGDHGKPFLLFDPDLVINISHSHQAGLLAVTVGSDQTLGIDIELNKPGRRFEAIAKRFFSEQEHRALLALSLGDRPAAFYRAWTRKEAYLKAWGTGLSFPSNRFTVSFDRAGRSELLASEMPGEGGQTWHFHEIRASHGHLAALCYPGTERWLRHYA